MWDIIHAAWFAAWLQLHCHANGRRPQLCLVYLAPLARRGKTPVDDLQEVRVLQCGLHALLVIELLVDCMLGLVRPGFNPDLDAIPRWQGAEQSDTER